MVKKILLICFLILDMLVQSQAQSFTASVRSNEVSLNQNFQVTFTADGKTSKFSPPDLSEFAVLSGPNQSTSIQMINGSFSQSISYSYILKPLKTGTLTIGPATIRINGKNYSSNSITIKVGNSTSGTKNTSKNKTTNPGSKKTDNIKSQIKKNLFLKAAISKSNVYSGEQLTVTYKLYQRIEIYQPQLTIPKYTGFWVEDITIKNPKASTETLDGVNYQVQTFKQTILFPQKTGKLTIDPLTIDCVVRVQSNQRRRSNFDDFFSDPFGFDPFGSSQNYSYTISTNPITINVKPLPVPQPLEFSGLVGQFDIAGSASSNTTKTNEAVTYKIKVTGKGNLSLLDAFKLDLPSDIETYEPKTKSAISKTVNGLSGSTTFEYLLIPQVKGEFTIPVVTLTYFDPVQEKYVFKATNPIQLKVSQGEEQNTGISQLSGADKKEIELRGTDIQFIRTTISPFKTYKPLYHTPLFFVLILSPVLLFILFLLYLALLKPTLSDPRSVLKRKAHRKAKATLAKAKKLIKKENPVQFYDAVHNAILHYLKDKFLIDSSEFSRSIVEESLRKVNISGQDITDLFNVLDACEYSRYAPGSSAPGLKELYEKAIHVVSSIENAR